jgi:hypothetical protein
MTALAEAASWIIQSPNTLLQDLFSRAMALASAAKMVFETALKWVLTVGMSALLGALLGPFVGAIKTV